MNLRQTTNLLRKRIKANGVKARCAYVSAEGHDIIKVVTKGGLPSFSVAEFGIITKLADSLGLSSISLAYRADLDRGVHTFQLPS